VAIGLEAITAVWRVQRSGGKFKQVQRQLGEAGAIPCLVKLVSTAPRDVQCQALAVLGILMEHNPANQDTALDCGAVHICLDLLRNIINSEGQTDVDEKPPPNADETNPGQVLALDLVTVSAVFALGLAIGNNRRSTQQALDQGLVRIASELLAKDISQSVLVLVLTLVHVLLDGCTAAGREQLLHAGGFWVLLGLGQLDEDERSTQVVTDKSALHWSILTIVTASCSARVGAEYLELGAIEAVQEAFEQTSGTNSTWALNIRRDCSKLLAALNKGSQASSYIQASLMQNDLRAICQTAADAALDNRTLSDPIEGLLESLLSSEDVSFVTRFLTTPGCLSIALQQPRTQMAIIKATSNWHVQLRLTGANPRCQLEGSSSLNVSVAMALLAPYHPRCAKALLVPGRLESLVAAFLDGFQVPQGHRFGATSSSGTKAESMTPAGDLHDRQCPSKAKSLENAAGNAGLPGATSSLDRKEVSEQDQLMHGEAAQSMVVLAAWMAALSTAMASIPAPPPPKKRPHGQGRHEDERLHRSKKVKHTRHYLVHLRVGEESLPCERELLANQSPFLGALIETLGDRDIIPMQCVSGFAEARMAECLRLVVQWFKSQALDPHLDPHTALCLWRVADFLELDSLKRACEGVVRSGLSDATVLKEAFSLATRPNCGGYAGGLMQVCISFLARNLEQSVANGMLKHLVAQHHCEIQTHLSKELTSMLSTIVFTSNK